MKLANNNISITDVKNALGVADNRVSHLCGNTHNKINVYSVYKPYPQITPLDLTDNKFYMTYLKNTKLKQYKLGDIFPSDTYAEYTVPKGGNEEPYRLGDFRSYSTDEHPHTFNLSQYNNTTIDPDKSGDSINIIYKHENNLPLLSYLAHRDEYLNNIYDTQNHYYYYDIILLAKYGSDTKIYRVARTSLYDDKISIYNICYDKDTFYDMISVDITKYTCILFGIAVPFISDYYKTEGRIIKNNYTLSLLPQTSTIKPFATNVKIKKPKDRVFLQAYILDNSNDNTTVIEKNTTVAMYSKGFELFNNLNNKNLFTTPQDSIYRGSDDAYIGNGWWLTNEDVYLDDTEQIIEMGMIIPNEYGNLNYYSNATTTNVDDGLKQVELFWNINLNNYKNKPLDLFVAISYNNRDYRD